MLPNTTSVKKWSWYLNAPCPVLLEALYFLLLLINVLYFLSLEHHIMFMQIQYRIKTSIQHFKWSLNSRSFFYNFLSFNTWLLYVPTVNYKVRRNHFKSYQQPFPFTHYLSQISNNLFVNIYSSKIQTSFIILLCVALNFNSCNNYTANMYSKYMLLTMNYVATDVEGVLQSLTNVLQVYAA